MLGQCVLWRSGCLRVCVCVGVCVCVFVSSSSLCCVEVCCVSSVLLRCDDSKLWCGLGDVAATNNNSSPSRTCYMGVRRC